MKARENHAIVLVPKVPLYNFVTKHTVNNIVKVRLVVLENGDAAYRKFRNERYVARSKKLGVTISNSLLTPTTKNKNNTRNKTATETTVDSISTHDIAFAQREAEIVSLHGISPEELYAHDLL